MLGRDPAEDERAGSGLEIFYDLVFVVAFSVAGVQLADYLAEGKVETAVMGYLLATFASLWAWINFAWFASAFDTDDWLYRILTMVQMVGVAIIAIGIPDVFTSIEHHEHVDLVVVIIGYMVMRVGMIAQWLRAALQAPAYRRSALTYAGMTTLAQIGWVVVAIVPTGLWATLAAILVCMAVELLGPAIAELRVGRTPWHPGHIAERYATLMVITLGEGVVGTVVVLQSLIARTGWSAETIVLGLTAMGVTFAMWWLYFLLPSGQVLGSRPEKCFGFGYASMPLYMACAAVGGGLHVIALWVEHEVHISDGAVLACLAVPLAVFTLGLIAMHAYLSGYRRPERLMTVAAVLPIPAAALALAAGAPLPAAVVVVCLTPVLPVVVAEVCTV